MCDGSKREAHDMKMLDQVSDIYVKLGNDLNSFIAAFANYGITMQ